jgi:hypothetical protein
MQPFGSVMGLFDSLQQGYQTHSTEGLVSVGFSFFLSIKPSIKPLTTRCGEFLTNINLSIKYKGRTKTHIYSALHSLIPVVYKVQKGTLLAGPSYGVFEKKLASDTGVLSVVDNQSPKSSHN